MKKAMAATLSLPSSFCFVITQQKRQWQLCFHHLLFVLLQHNKESDDNNIVVTFFFSCCSIEHDGSVIAVIFCFRFATVKKAMVTSLSLPSFFLLQRSEESDNCDVAIVVVAFFIFVLLPHRRRWLPLPSFLFFLL